MKLSAKPLIEVGGVNNFIYSQQLKMMAGDPAEFYFQLVDLEQNPASCGFNPAGLRYMPQTISTLAITFINIDSAKQFTRFASQPFAQDPSIWKVELLATDPINGTVSINGVLTENFGTEETPNLKTKKFNLQACILAYPV